MSKNKYLILSVILSVVFVAAITYGATTISTNVNTGGTLTVTGASTLTGAVWATSTLQATGIVTFYDDLVVDTDTLFVDASADRVGIGTSTPSAFFSVGEGAGTLTGDVYLTGGLTVGATTSINSVEGTVLLASSRMGDPTGVEGLIYYNASSKNVRLYNGTAWGVIGTSTGIDFSGSNITLSGMSNRFLLGTSTGQGNSFMVLEATSTTAIPLTLVARASQTANTLQIRDAGSVDLLYVNSAGGLFGSTTGQFTGALTTYGGVTLGNAANDAITLTGNASTTNALTVGGNLYINGFATTTAADGNIATQGTLTVTGKTTLGNASGTRMSLTDNFMVNGLATTTASNGNIDTAGKLTAVNASTTRITASGYASTTSLIIGGNGSTMSGLIFGYCTIATVTIQASSSDMATCDSTTGGAGIRSGDRVMVTATSSLPQNFAIQAASSTAVNTIQVRIRNHGDSTGTVATGVNSFNFIGIR